MENAGASKKKWKVIKRVFLAVLLAGIATGFIGSARIVSAAGEAKEFAERTGIPVTFERGAVSGSAGDAGFLNAVCRLAAWEEDTVRQIDEAFGFSEDPEEELERKEKRPLGYEPKEEILRYELKQQWKELRSAVKTETRSVIDELYGGLQVRGYIRKEDLRSCYREGGFRTIAAVFDRLRDGNAMEAYRRACSAITDHESSCVPMDVAYRLYPEQMLAACEDCLRDSMENGSLYSLEREIKQARKFSLRYSVTVANLSDAMQQYDDMEYDSRPEVPRVGMSYSQALETKLGYPTRKVDLRKGRNKYSNAPYGYMYWCVGEKTIFCAHYYDGEITEVNDYRDSKKTGNTRRKPSHSGSSDSEIDPDDYDVEAYYEDNMDYYDDFDDAYDGFMDDDAEWDDYG